MIVNKNCTLCKGSGRVENNFGKFICPECEYADLFKKALEMKEDKAYRISASNRADADRMLILFSKPSINHSWHIELLFGNRIRRVDWLWMK